jgi:acyl-CoA reductase-like NAD-dependent aldehyde dehydrogenase
LNRRAKLAIKWEKLGFSGRKKVLLAWSDHIIKNIDQIASIVSLETGKPFGDAKLEASIAVSHIGWAARHAEEIYANLIPSSWGFDGQYGCNS